MRRVRTGISPEYVKDWDIEKAIREIVQNYLDSRSEFGCGGSITWSEGLAKIKDNGPGLQMKHLAMGISEKGLEAIGKFGEGLKLALMVMAREDRSIQVWSNGMIISPHIEWDEDYQTETMQFRITDMEPRHAAKFTGTSIKFTCSKEELNAGKAYFMAFQKAAKTSIEWLERGRISRPGGSVYVNGAKVGEIDNAMFSYHISGQEGYGIGNRDRTSIASTDLDPIIQRMLTTTPSLKVMESILESIKAGQSVYEGRVGVDEYSIPSGHMRTWRKAINSTFGKNAVISEGNTAQDTQAEYRGHEAIRVPFMWKYPLKALGMPTMESISKDMIKGAKSIRIEDLEDDERGNLEYAISLISERYSEVGEVKISDSLEGLAGTSGGVSVSGLYEPSTSTIYLKRSILSDRRDTLETLIHEMVHAVSGASDCTSEFENALCKAIVKVMLHGQQ